MIPYFKVYNFLTNYDSYVSSEVWAKHEYLLTLEPPLVLLIAFTDRKCILCALIKIGKLTGYWRN